MISISRRGKVLLAAIAILLLLMITPRSARADDAGGIAVTGTGEATTRPAAVEIDATVSGDGELATDATVKYRDTKKKAVAALEALKIPNLVVESEGQQLTQALDPTAQARMMNGMPASSTQAKVRVVEKLKVLINRADTVEPDKLLDTSLKVIDAARDAGLEIGPPAPSNYIEAQLMAGQGSTLVTFIIPDPSALRDQAYEKAIADARAKAEKLAALSGVKLGPVTSVQEQEAAHSTDSRAQMLAMVYGITPAQKDSSNAVRSTTLKDIPVTVQLSVRFAILPGDGK